MSGGKERGDRGRKKGPLNNRGREEKKVERQPGT